MVFIISLYYFISLDLAKVSFIVDKHHHKDFIAELSPIITAYLLYVTGFGLVLDSSVSDKKGLTMDDGCVFNVASDTILSNNLLDDAEDILVYGLQGKSQYPGVWSLSSIIASNRNLVEVDPNKQDDDIGYILPEEGIDKALCSKALVLSRGNLNPQ